MRLTIGKKLNGLVISLLLMSIGGVVILATQLFTSNLEELLRKGTIDMSALLSGRVRAEMKHVADRTRTLGAASLENFQYPEDRLKFIQDSLATDSQYLGLSLYRKSDEKTPWTNVWRIVHPEAEKKYELNGAEFSRLDKESALDFESVSKGRVDFTVAHLKDGTPSLRMALPFVRRADGTFSQILAIELNQERLTSLFNESTEFTSYLVDRNGRVLGSTDPSKIPLGTDLSSLAIVADIKAGRGSTGKDYADRAGQMQMGAFQKVGFADLAVVSQVPLEKALSAQVQLYRRTGFLAGMFLFIAMGLGFLFSQSLTRPIEALASAATRVANGDFTVRLAVKKKGGDEVQEFSSTFNQMVSGLEERDRVKATFAKFHSKEVAEKLMSGAVNLGGERRSAAVFFSDVRGFTAMSEKMEPEALVKVLNRYMSRMVHIVIANGGIVDKFVGDAIMAVWGVPMGKEDDCHRAVKASLEMRVALAELNAELLAEGLPPLKIGMGLNYGPLIAGNIGSDERMEYTVIGDTVNTASRVESSTKEFGTDLLISKELLDQLGGRFLVTKVDEIKVKGKTEPLQFFTVQGYIDENGKEVIVETPYSSYHAEKSDKVVHNKPAAEATAPDEHSKDADAAEQVEVARAAEPAAAELALAPEPAATENVTTDHAATPAPTALELIEKLPDYAEPTFFVAIDAPPIPVAPDEIVEVEEEDSITASPTDDSPALLDPEQLMARKKRSAA